MRYQPTMPMAPRPKKCPSGGASHPINPRNADKCPLSHLQDDLGATEGHGGKATAGTDHWSEKTLTAKQLEGYGFRVEDKPGQVAKAVCEVCGLRMSLRRR